MEKINNYNDPYYGNQSTQKNTFGKPQVSLLTRSMFIAGGGFILICGLSVFFAWLFAKFVNPRALGAVDILFPVILCSILISMIISMLWTKILWKGKSIGLTILVYSLYIISMSIGFGYLFANLYNSTGPRGSSIMFIAFGLTGLIFLIVSLIAKVIGIKGMLTFGKLIAITGAVVGVFMFAFLITLIVCLATRNPIFASRSADLVNWLCLIFISMSMFFYIIIDIKTIMATDEFTSFTGAEESSAIQWFFGFRLLTDIINVLFIVVLWLIRLSRK